MKHHAGASGDGVLMSAPLPPHREGNRLKTDEPPAGLEPSASAPGDLEPLFLPHLPPVPPPLPPGAYESALATAVERVTRRYPTLPREPGRWLPIWARLWPVQGDPLLALASLHVEDLALAGAVVDGNGAAVVIFERECLAHLLPSLRRQGVTPDREGEAIQIVRQHLLIPPEGGQARLLRYAGRGDLRRWVQMAGLRALRPTLQRWRQDHRRQADVHEMEGLAAANTPAELGLMTSHHQRAFKQAFQLAFTRLDTRARNLLRYQILSGLNIDQIGLIYQVHRATVARWLATAREQLLGDTRTAMMENLRLNPEELDSLLRDIQSQMDVSLHRLLAPGASAVKVTLSRVDEEKEGATPPLPSGGRQNNHGQ